MARLASVCHAPSERVPRLGVGLARITLSQASIEDQVETAAQHLPEDQGGARIPDEIEARFGDNVAKMVAGPH